MFGISLLLSIIGSDFLKMCLHQDVRASLCASSPKGFKHALLTAERIKTEALLLGILSEASTGHHRLIIKKLPMESLRNFML